MLGETAHLTTQLDLNDGLTPGLSRAKGAVAGFDRTANQSLARVQKGAGEVGRGLIRVGAVAATVAAVGLAGAAKAAIDFEDAFAGVRKTVDEADLRKAGMSFEGLARDFRNMALEIPIAATEFARLGETAGALGVRAKDIKEFARVTALMGVTTNLSADAAADAFGRIGTILGLTGKEYTELADSIVALGNAGASTESEITEITKRFAAEAKAMGLAKEQIVGLASATASLGFAPERGGTALARVFGNLSTNISTANAKGKALSKELGIPIKELQRDIDQGKGLPIFLNLLKEIRGMKPTEAARFLKDIGVTNVSDRTIFRNMAANLPFVNEQLEIATKATGALTEEAQKRFDTVRSKFQLLKNAGIEAGITLGEGFAPALGRAATRLSTWIKNNRHELVGLGRDIGAAIDGIDWDRVMGAVKTLVGLFKSAWDIIKQIPPELAAMGLGAIGLNKISGGLLGSGISNIVGGLAGAATKGALGRVPGLGRFVAQPVYVTNWNEAGLAGAGGQAGQVTAGGFLKGALRLGAGVGIGLAAQMVGDQLGGTQGEIVNSMGIVAGALVTGGPVLAALAAISLGIEKVWTVAGQISEGQAENRTKARDVGGNMAEANKNLVNMTRLMKETQGFDRDLLKTFNATELGDALKNASDALVNGADTAAKREGGIKTLESALAQATEYGWTQVADHLRANIERLRKGEGGQGERNASMVRAVAAGAAAGVTRGMKKSAKDDDDKAFRKVIDHLKQVDSHKGNERLFGRSSDRLAERVARAMRSTGDKSDRVVRQVIRQLEREQKRALNAGHTKLARNLGRDINVMKNVLGRKTDTSNQRLNTIANKDTSVAVTVPVTTSVSIRDVQRTTTTSARYGMQAI